MVMENIFRKMVLCMKVNGKMISKRVRDMRDRLMGRRIRDSFRMVKKMETEYLFFPMVLIIKDNSRIIIFKEKGIISIILSLN
jgi:hypothetical protein